MIIYNLNLFSVIQVPVKTNAPFVVDPEKINSRSVIWSRRFSLSKSLGEGMDWIVAYPFALRPPYQPERAMPAISKMVAGVACSYKIP